MIPLGKTLEIPLTIDHGTVIRLGRFNYSVGRSNESGYYLSGMGVSNRQMFADIDCPNPYEWCENHHIQTNGTHGTFPYMNLSTLRKTIKILMNEFHQKGKEARIIGTKDI